MLTPVHFATDADMIAYIEEQPKLMEFLSDISLLPEQARYNSTDMQLLRRFAVTFKETKEKLNSLY